MSDDQPNADEGASPTDDVKKQNPGATTTGDQTGEADDDSSGQASDDPHKVEELAKARSNSGAAESRSE